MFAKKATLGALVLALSSTGCKTNLSNAPSVQAHPITIEPDKKDHDESFDSIDDKVSTEHFSYLLDSTYFIISESQYEDPSGETATFHSLGSGVLFKDVGVRTYLSTAAHVVDNEDEIFDFFGNKYEKKSERFYLLEDHQVRIVQRVLRTLTENSDKDDLYFIDKDGEIKELNHIVRTSDDLRVLLSIIKPREVRIDAKNNSIDWAYVSVSHLPHVPIVYDIGDTDKLQPQNMVFVTGYPLGLVKNLNRGFVTSKNDSYLARDDPKSRFIFDASISPGNSGGGIFASADGKFKLVGLTSAMYLRANDLYIGIKINAAAEIFKENSILCSDGWECNTSLPYEIKLSE